jgi:hypothetical protein
VTISFVFRTNSKNPLKQFFYLFVDKYFDTLLARTVGHKDVLECPCFSTPFEVKPLGKSEKMWVMKPEDASHLFSALERSRVQTSTGVET